MNARDVIAGIFLVALTLGIALQQLTESPPTWVDEGMIAQLAINLSEKGVYGIQIAPDTFVSGAFITVGFPVLAPLAAVFSLFGTGLFEARMFMVFWIVALVIGAWWYIRRHYGLLPAFFSGLLLATFPPLYANGKNVMGEVPGLVFFIGLLFLLEKWHPLRVPTWRYMYMFLVALVIGLCIVTKPVFLPMLGALLIVYGWTYVRGEHLPLGWRDIGIGIVGFSIPVAVWLTTQFFPGDSVADVLAFYANPYGVEDVFGTIFANIARFFTETSPIYIALIMGVWTLSLGIREFKRGEMVPSTAERAAFAFACLVLASYLRTPGWYKYFFVPQILGLIYLPAALLHISTLLPSKRSLLRIGAVLVLTLLTAFHTYLLFFDSWISSYSESARSAMFAGYFASYDPQSPILIYNAPELAFFLPEDTTYYQYLWINTGIDTGGGVAAAAVERKAVDTIIARLGVGDAEEDMFPGYVLIGRLNSFHVFSRER